MANEEKYGSDEVTTKFFEFYNSQLGLLEKLYLHQHTKLSDLPETRLGNLFFLLYDIHHTGMAISILSVHNHISGCYILSRAFLEKIINYVYLLSSPNEEYSNYVSYSKQKIYRGLNRNFIAGNSKVSLTWTGFENLVDDAEIKKAFDLFTSEKGKPKTRWTSKNLSRLLESIENNGGHKIAILMLAILAIYDDASEALHGTIYGSIFYAGIYPGEKITTEQDLRELWNGKLIMLFLLLGACVNTLILAFNKLSPIENLVNDSKNNVDSILITLRQSTKDRSTS